MCVSDILFVKGGLTPFLIIYPVHESDPVFFDNFLWKFPVDAVHDLSDALAETIVIFNLSGSMVDDSVNSSFNLFCGTSKEWSVVFKSR